MDSLQDTEILNLVEKCQEIIDQYQQDDEISTVLLIGDHFSGKSTIFNFLSGANFNFNGERDDIEITNKSEKYSQMNNGMNSVTKTLNVYKNNQNNHLIIDFPAELLNTNGSKNQQLINLIFNKIVTSGPIKLIYVLNCYENHLPNRGQQLVHFCEMLKNPYFSLLLNKNMYNKSDEKMIRNIVEELEFIYSNYLYSKPRNDQILILKKAKKNSSELIFNDYSRKTLWSQIEQAKEKEIKPLKILQDDKVSSYINNLQWEFVNEYLNHLLNENFNEKDQKQTKKEAEDFYENMQQLFYFAKKGNQKTALQWYQKFIELCNKLMQNDSIKSKKIEESKNFLKIFQYFEQEFNKINCNSNLDIIISFVKNQLQNIEAIYQKRRQSLNKQQDLENKMNLQFKEIQNTITKLQEEKFQLERENFLLKKENEKEKLQRQLLETQLKL